MAEYETVVHDVLVIGAGGAGLRAAIAAATEGEGVSVGVICKSLLGKAHTVMAEGGIAASLGNVDDRDNWKVHFSDTMRGGQYLNNWRMAELHAKEAPARRFADGSRGPGACGSSRAPCGRRRARDADT
jgi:succinate dehydrogenase / fumarate reductase flavoprotein subunit